MRYILFCSLFFLLCHLPSRLDGACNKTVTIFPHYESFEQYNNQSNVFSNSGWYTDNQTQNSIAVFKLAESPAYNSSYYVHGDNAAVFDPFSQDPISEVTAYFYSPCFDLSNALDAQFHFNYRTSVSGIFKLQITTDGGSNWSDIWDGNYSTTYTHHWESIDLDMYAGQQIQLRFYINNTPGSIFSDLIFIDAIQLEAGEPFSSANCNTTISSFPYQNGFESGWGGFTHHAGNDTDWVLGNVAGIGGSYEGSYQAGSPNDLYPSILESPCFDLSSVTDAAIHFVSSANIKVSVHAENEPDWVTVFERSGAQSTYWRLVTIDLNDYVGKVIQLRFWDDANDIRIDAVNLVANIDTSQTGGGGGTNPDSSLLWRVKNTNVYVVNKKVGIGVDQADGYDLAVNGKIKARELNVTTTEWPDYVFSPDYPLPSLIRLKEYILSNGHLPNIPSEQEIHQDGMFLGQMNVKLLEKIEELTLYILKQEEQITELEKRLDGIRQNTKKQKQ